ncbi:MAG: universal stress protein [Gemmatimonadota bacterium]
MRRILVPLDGSPLARWALPWALALRAALRGEVELVAVHSPLDIDWGPAAEGVWNVEVRKAEEATLAAEATRIEEAGHPRPSTLLLERAPGPAIVGRAAETDADVIVMATHGRGGVSRAWLGSVASYVVRHADALVLIVHPVDDGTQPDLRALPLVDTILMPVDGSRFAEAATPHAAELAQAFEAGIVLMRAVATPYIVGSPYMPQGTRMYAEERERRLATANDYLQNIETRIEAPGAVRSIVAETEAAHAIPAVAEEEGADLVVMATHGRGALLRTIVGSVADKVMRTSPVPVLLVRPERQELESTPAEEATLEVAPPGPVM